MRTYTSALPRRGRPCRRQTRAGQSPARARRGVARRGLARGVEPASQCSGRESALTEHRPPELLTAGPRTTTRSGRVGMDFPILFAGILGYPLVLGGCFSTTNTIAPSRLPEITAAAARGPSADGYLDQVVV